MVGVLHDCYHIFQRLKGTRKNPKNQQISFETYIHKMKNHKLCRGIYLKEKTNFLQQNFDFFAGD